MRGGGGGNIAGREGEWGDGSSPADRSSHFRPLPPSLHDCSRPEMKMRRESRKALRPREYIERP